MAARKITRVTTTEETNPNEPLEINEDEPGLEQPDQSDLEAQEKQNFESEVNSVCEALEGKGAKVLVKRCPPGASAFEIVTRMSVEDFQEKGPEGIIEDYGGGRYELRFTDKSNKYFKQLTFTADKRIRGRLDAPLGSNGNGAEKAEVLIREMTAKTGSDMATVMMQMMQLQAQQNTANLQMLTAAMAQPKSNGLKDFAVLLTPAVPLILKLIEGRSQDSTLKAIETLAKAKELFGGSGDGDSGVESILKSLGPLVAAKLSQPQQSAQVDTGAPQQPAPLDNPQLPAPDADNPEMIKLLVVRSVRAYYPMLLKAAQRDSDPGSYFDVMMDNLENSPAAAILALIEILKSDEWAKELFAVDPLPFPKWFEALRGHFLEWYAEQQKPEEAEEKAPEIAVVPPQPPTAKPKK